MLLWSFLGLASPHPTDRLPVSESEQSGLQIIIGGNIEAELSGTLTESTTTHTLVFVDDGQNLDVQAADGVWVAHVVVGQKGGEAPLSLKMGETILWNEPIPIGAERTQLYLKVLIKQGRPIVKVDTFDTDAPPPAETENDLPPPSEADLKLTTPSASIPTVTEAPQNTLPPPAVPPFYESNLLLQILSTLIFLGLGFAAGSKYRQWKPPRPLHWLYMGNGKHSSEPVELLLGQRQCWSCHPSVNRIDLISMLIQALRGSGPILVLAHPARHGTLLQKYMGEAGLFISTEVPTPLSEATAQVHFLRRMGNPIVIIDDIQSLETAQNHEQPAAVVQDMLYWLPEGTSILALVSENYTGIVQHHLNAVEWPRQSPVPEAQSRPIQEAPQSPPLD